MSGKLLGLQERANDGLCPGDAPQRCSSRAGNGVRHSWSMSDTEMTRKKEVLERWRTFDHRYRMNENVCLPSFSEDFGTWLRKCRATIISTGKLFCTFFPCLFTVKKELHILRPKPIFFHLTLPNSRLTCILPEIIQSSTLPPSFLPSSAYHNSRVFFERDENAISSTSFSKQSSLF